MEFVNHNNSNIYVKKEKDGNDSAAFDDEEVNCLIEYLSSGDELSAFGKYNIYYRFKMFPN